MWDSLPDGFLRLLAAGSVFPLLAPPLHHCNSHLTLTPGMACSWLGSCLSGYYLGWTNDSLVIWVCSIRDIVIYYYLVYLYRRLVVQNFVYLEVFLRLSIPRDGENSPSILHNNCPGNDAGFSPQLLYLRFKKKKTLGLTFICFFLKKTNVNYTLFKHAIHSHPLPFP